MTSSVKWEMKPSFDNSYQKSQTPTLRGPGYSTVREAREDRGQPESTATLPPPPGSTGAADSAHLCRPRKLGARSEAPRWRRQARTLCQGTTGVRRSLPPRGAAPAGASRCPPRACYTYPGTRLRPPSSLTCAHPALPGVPAVSTSPPAPPTSSKRPSPRQSPRWLLLRACPARAPEPPRKGGQVRSEAAGR